MRVVVVDDMPRSPGDRYPVMVRDDYTCDGDFVDEEGARCMLAVVPYTYTFRASVKGRWLGLPLLTVFVREFAYIMPLAAGGEPRQATLDPRITIPAYVEEIRTGSIRLHGREAECLAAGRAYDLELRQLLQDSCLRSTADSGSSSSNEDVTRWERRTEVEMMELLDSLPPRLLLRQKDVILHQVLRCEAPMPCEDPLHILRYDHVSRGAPPRRLLVVRKPSGVPVHPSGRCCKNSVTAILQDVFGGIDAHRYHAVPLREPNRTDGVECVAIRHRQYNFELIRVWVGDGYVRRDAWTALHAMLLMEGSQLSGLKVFVVHRLDAATSGVLVFGLDSVSARMTAELLTQKEAMSVDRPYGCEDATAVTMMGCTKQYLARVRGCFDAVKLSAAQHHCACLSPSPSSSSSSSRMKESDASCWLRVDRPIGCLSHHKSLYWCPDAALTSSWLEEEAKRNCITKKADDNTDGELQRRGTSEGATTPSVPTACRKRAPRRNAVELEAKHARMRHLTIGRRGQEAETKRTDEVDHVPGSNEVGRSNTSTRDKAKEETRRLRETMRRAVTLVRSLAYDAACDESVVECLLLTGRTHQVRVHLASLGHPICGDLKYISHATAVRALTTSAPPLGCPRAQEEEEEEEEEERCDGEESPLSTRIFLHAWRYTFRYASDEEPELMEAPPPTWASVVHVRNGMPPPPVGDCH